MAVWMVTLNQRWLGQEVRNVVYYESPLEELSPVEQTAIADEIRAAFAVASNWNNARTDNWSFYGITLRRVDQQGWPSIVVAPTGGTLVGTSGSENIPTQVAILLHGTAYSQRPNRVRMYLAGFAEGVFVDGLVGAAFKTAALNFASGIHEINAITEGFGRVAVQWTTDNQEVALWNQITDYYVSDVPGTQRRRRIGRGA